VIKGRTSPACRIVTSLACSGETSGGMGRIVRPGVVRLVATVAIGRGSRVIPIDMTCRASNAYMRAGEWESCLAVIKRRRLPGRRAVADGTSCRNPRGCVGGICRAGVILCVACIAIRRS
jgi:hypothetical protein